MPSITVPGNPPGPFRLLFLDIDGTLVDAAGRVSERMLTALHKTQSMGCTPVLCTGRSLYAAQKAADQIGGKGYGIVLNGALIYGWETGEIVRERLLPGDTVQQAVQIAYARRMAPIWLGMEDGVDRIITDRLAPLWPPYAERNASRIRFVDRLDTAMPAPPASLAAYGTEQAALALAAEWQTHLGASVISVAGPTAVYHGWYAQLTTADAEKGSAAAYLAHRLGVPREQTLAIGDHVNDIGLLRWCGWGICMGDGHPDARAAADYVTGTLAEDGAAAALERVILASDKY